ncbi:hypothetical protein D3C80_1402410 [compost metagenome]
MSKIRHAKFPALNKQKQDAVMLTRVRCRTGSPKISGSCKRVVLGDLRGEASAPAPERSVTLDKRVARAAHVLDRAQANDAVTIMISRFA